MRCGVHDERTVRAMLETPGVVDVNCTPGEGGASPLYRLGRVGLPVLTAVSAATYFMLKARTAEMYSKYQPPELRDVAGFITLSSYHRCCNFLFFQASKTLYKVHSMWSNPGHAVFLATAPKRNELYARLYGMPSDQADGAATELPP